MNIMRAIRMSAATAVTLFVAACGDNSASDSTKSTTIDEKNQVAAQTQIKENAPAMNATETSAEKVTSEAQVPEVFSSEYIKETLIPLFEKQAPITIDDDMSITRLEAEGRKIFYVLDYHPRNRRAVIPQEMQVYLDRMTQSVCNSASNQELLPKVESLGYRMEYQGERIAESVCPQSSKEPTKAQEQVSLKDVLEK